MGQVARFFDGHPGRLGAALLTITASSVVVWYLGSPLFVRTYSNEALPSAAAVAPTATAGAQPTAATTASDASAGPRVLAAGKIVATLIAVGFIVIAVWVYMQHGGRIRV